MDGEQLSWAWQHQTFSLAQSRDTHEDNQEKTATP